MLPITVPEDEPPLAGEQLAQADCQLHLRWTLLSTGCCF